MYENVQSPLEQIWSLLNFGPEEVFTSVGEVRQQVITHRENISILKSNALGAMLAIAQMSDGIGAKDVGAMTTLNNLLNIQSLISEWSEMLEYALERDVIALEVWLDVAAGRDASLN